MNDGTIWTYLIIYGIAFGILSSIAANKKNRDQAGWFFIGLFFGIFGFIAALIVDKIEPPNESLTVSNEFDPSLLTKKCPDCAETIKLEAKVCRFCQHRFSDEEVTRHIEDARANYLQARQLQSVPIGKSDWECPKCHTISKIDLPFCHVCQYSRDKALSQLAPSFAPSGSHWDCPRCHRINRNEQITCLACGFTRSPTKA